MTTSEAKFTRADYEQLPEGIRAELLDGVLVKEPASTAWHQDLVLELGRILVSLVGRGRVLVSPIDICIDDWNVLQPDVIVLPPSGRIQPGDRQAGIPLLVIEVLSPATADRDRRQKAGIYFDAGVEEVWLVDPDLRTVEVLAKGSTSTFRIGEIPRSEAVTGFAPDLHSLFRE